MVQSDERNSEFLRSPLNRTARRIVRRQPLRLVLAMLLLLMLLMLQGCATVLQRSTAGKVDESPLPAEYFEPQALCINAWHGLLDEWVSATGGASGTIKLTHGRIASDRHSRLSRIFRRVWDAQDGGAESDWWSLAKQLEVATSEVIANDDLPGECGALTWLQPLLIESPWVMTDDVRKSLLASAPVDARKDSRVFSRWFLQEILTRE